MALPYKVANLDGVPEAQRPLYEKKGDSFVLAVDGVRGVDEIGELERAFERQKEKNRQLQEKALGEDDRKEYQRLKDEQKLRDENKLKEEGKWSDLRTQLDKEHDEKLNAVRADLGKRDAVIERLTVTNEVNAAIAAAGIKDEYRPAVAAMLMQQRPKVVYDGENPKGVFPDELHGDQPIASYVEKWAKSDQAKAFLPPQTKNGGGAPGTDGKPTGAEADLLTKPWSELSQDEKVARTEAKYGAGAV